MTNEKQPMNRISAVIVKIALDHISNLLALVYVYTELAIPALSMTLQDQHGPLYHLPEYQLFSAKKNAKMRTKSINKSYCWTYQKYGLRKQNQNQ